MTTALILVIGVLLLTNAMALILYSAAISERDEARRDHWAAIHCINRNHKH